MSDLIPLVNPLSQMIRQDLMAGLLEEKRSANTRHAYAKDLRDFFRTVANSEPTPEMVGYFLRLEQVEAVALVTQYKGKLIERKLSQATVNRRLSAIKALVGYGRKLGKCHYTRMLKIGKNREYFIHSFHAVKYLKLKNKG